MSNLTGSTLGPYQILEQLGLGGMATVYKGYQPSMDRTVAIKILPQHFAQDPTFVGRFEQEARTIANLEHARILPVYDYGKEGTITYIVMRYLDAGTLSDRIDEGPMDPVEASRIMSQIAEGLDYAHSRGVIHRDMKPANVMLDSSGDVYITDFGIAKLVAADSQFTGSGIIGTPAYVSPEQGLGKTIDLRSDIYALGVVLYEMITGMQPYDAETPMAVVLKHINEPLPIPRLVISDLDPGVESVILKALAKDPDDRYSFCGEMAAALRDAVADLGDAGRRSTRSPETTQPIVMPGDPAAVTAQGPFDDDSTIAVGATFDQDVMEKERSPLLVVGAVIGGIILLVAIGALVMGALRSRPSAGKADTSPSPGDGAETADATGEETDSESAGSEPVDQPTSSVDESDSQAMLTCPDGTTELVSTDFSGNTPPNFELPAGAELVAGDDGKNWLHIRAEEPVRVQAGSDLLNSTITMVVAVPVDAPDTSVGFRMRVSETGEYAATISSAGGITLLRNGESVAESTIEAVSGDRPHRLEMRILGSVIALNIDGEDVLTFEDADPLPAGGSGLGVLEGEALIFAISACEMSGAAGGEPIFSEDFDSDTLDTDSWVWINEPGGRWAIEEGQLMMPVIAGTGAGEGAAGPPMLVLTDLPVELNNGVVQVDVTLMPTQNFQGAGLVILGADRDPLLLLTRSYCDVSDVCQGDAIYFDHLGELVQSRDAYRPHVAGAGELPAGGPVSLRLVRLRNTLTGMYRVGDGRWQEVGTWPVLDAQFGAIGLITTAGAQTVDEIDVLFDNVGLLEVSP